MNAKTLKALKGSIEKWQKIVSGMRRDEGSSNCPLCREFLHTHDCVGCPVFESTGRVLCRDTPYGPYDKVGAADYGSPYGKALAIAELEFLKTLLPKRAKR